MLIYHFAGTVVIALSNGVTQFTMCGAAVKKRELKPPCGSRIEPNDNIIIHVVPRIWSRCSRNSEALLQNYEKILNKCFRVTSGR